MSRHHIPIGSDQELDTEIDRAAADAGMTFAGTVDAVALGPTIPYVTVGTAAPGAAYLGTPFFYNSAGTASYVWGGTSYVSVKATY